MAKLYFNQASKNKKNVENLNPRKETVAFILNYSKALHVAEREDLSFETILN